MTKFYRSNLFSVVGFVWKLHFSLYLNVFCRTKNVWMNQKVEKIEKKWMKRIHRENNGNEKLTYSWCIHSSHSVDSHQHLPNAIKKLTKEIILRILYVCVFDLYFLLCPSCPNWVNESYFSVCQQSGDCE